MSNKQTAVDIFHDRVIEMLARKRPLTTNEVAKVWAELKELEKQQIVEACNQTEFEDIDGMGIHEIITKGEQYYKETYED